MDQTVFEFQRDRFRLAGRLWKNESAVQVALSGARK
jgi:hypothetical protein